LIYSSIISIIIGTLGGLYQIKIKKLLAYSAINHIGFLLVGFSSFNVMGLFSLFFYIIVYIIISLNIFSILLSLRKIDNNLKFKKISEFVLLFKSNNMIAIIFCIILFSIAGLPPLVGFYSKLYIFISAIKSEIYLISIIAAIFSVIASLYYIRLIKLMFFKTFNY
jgi:NADH:ubiquinone oxidoreductase subunit 2 (subunit N)